MKTLGILLVGLVVIPVHSEDATASGWLAYDHTCIAFYLYYVHY